MKPSTLSRLNDYSIPPLSSINEHRDLLERGMYRDRAAAKIQAAYRGYTVRKSLPWLNDKHKYLDDEFNKRVGFSLEKQIISLKSTFFSQCTIGIHHQIILICV